MRGSRDKFTAADKSASLNDEMLELGLYQPACLVANARSNHISG